MNAYTRGLSVLFAIGATLLALYAYRFLPEKRYLATNDPDVEVEPHYRTVDGPQTGYLKKANYFRCKYREGIPDCRYYCSRIG
ncbi:hypothetical protein P886_0360 [Alteromonadaceae bacterium 2753L.S.0a.02]|nr:hypothetical protein P886_0360 [Alteromonadaceae bacterium 2753L.S.0a.02]